MMARITHSRSNRRSDTHPVALLDKGAKNHDHACSDDGGDNAPADKSDSNRIARL
jgi:hypothetical protein